MRSHLFRLGRNTAIYGTGQVLLRMVSLLLLPLYTSYLTPTDYGISSILGVMTYFLAPLFQLGISTAMGIVYFAREAAEERSATIWTAFVTLLASGTLLVLAGFFTSDALAGFLFPDAQSDYDLSYLVRVTLATTAMSIAVHPLLARLQFEERAKAFVAISLSSSALSIALSVTFIVGLGRGVAGFIEAAALAQAVTFVVALLVSIRGLAFRIRRAIARELIVLGIPLVPGILAVYVMLQGNKFLLQAGAGLDELGLYSLGFNIGLLMTLLVTGFTTAWFPFFSSFMPDPEEGRPIFGRVLTYYVLGAGTVSLMFFIGAQPLVRLVTQPAFWDAYVSVGPSAAAQFLIGLHSVLLAGMYLTKQVRLTTVIQGAAAVVSIALNLLLIPALGALGAALGLIGGFVALVVFQHAWNVTRLQYRVPFDRRLIVYAGVYVAVAALFLWDRDAPLAVEVALSVLGAAGVVAVVLVLLTPAERAYARSQISLRLGRASG